MMHYLVYVACAGAFGVGVCGAFGIARAQARRQSLKSALASFEADQSAQKDERHLPAIARYFVRESKLCAAGSLVGDIAKFFLKRNQDKAAQALALAGLGKSVSPLGFYSGRVKLTLMVGFVAGVVGYVSSASLALLLLFAGMAYAWFETGAVLKRMREERSAFVERHLPEMLEVITLGLKSGLTFDKSFELYTTHFDSDFCKDCADAYQSWTAGLVGRDAALYQLAASVDSLAFSRVVENMVRSVRFGSSLAQILEEQAREIRASYKSAREEAIAKISVKMMIPMGAMMLPAMMLLVLGPVILSLISGI